MAGRYRVVWSEAAIQDVESILGWIMAHESPVAAAHVYELVTKRAETLAQAPDRGRVVPEIREMGIVDFRELIEPPYRICYRVHGRDAVIVSVLDGRRDLERVLVDRAMRR